MPLDGAGGFQIGSTMKPFVFAQWLNAGKSMNTVLNGAVRVYPAGLPLEELLRHHHGLL